MNETVQRIISTNKQLEYDINQIRRRLKEVSVNSKHVVPSLPSSLERSLPNLETDTDVVRERCKLLKSQIDQLNNNNLLTYPYDHDLRFKLLCEDYKKRISMSKECCSFLDTNKKTIAEALERERKQQMELEALIHAAEQKLQETGQLSKKDVYKRLKTKCQKVDQMNKEKAEQMVAFLDEHYPLPDQEAFTKVKKKMERVVGMENMRLETLLPLKDIVQSLMDACQNDPNNPYIIIDHRHWPPYVELLLQCDLALRHPTDCTRIKLFPFHL